ncbi:unnamed protein product [Euphydryas editha]|uniref:Reverse transcriptase n=1 Tax=Euphydryas editha TaxID=104508 RepID=A0AAU9U977_EUPED|nr:unnamed protein product [Euphydryas editha]
MRTIVEAARTMLQAKGLGKEFWAEAVSTAIYVINRTGRTKEAGKTPFELFYNKQKYDITLLKTFGTEAYVHIPTQKRLKWDSKSMKGIFVGYGINTKGYRVWLINNKVIGTYRDVIFVTQKKEEQNTLKSMEKIEREDRIEKKYYIQNITEPRNTEECFKENENHEYDTGRETNIQETSTEVRDQHSSHGTEESCNDGQSYVDKSYDTEEYLSESGQEEYLDIDDQSYISTDDDNNNDEEITEDRTKTTRSRIIKKPSHLNDYYTGFTAVNNSELSYEEAINSEYSEKWKEAIQTELQALQKNKTWIETYLPEDKKAIETKWVFKIKKENGQNKYKARLVVRGFQQQDKLDHSEIYAPVAKLPTLRILLAIACKYNLNISQMDVKNAFLNGEIEEEVYLKLPKGIEVADKNKVLKLQKSLYGLKKSPKNWNDRFNNFMIKQGFERSKADYCLYYKKNLKFYLLLYVDDLIILCEKKEDIERLKFLLQKEFDMTNLGNNNKFTYLARRGTKEKNKNDSRENSSSRKKIKYNTKNETEDRKPMRKPLELETDPSVLQRRQKQIDYGKNTVGYYCYTQKVPIDKRTKDDPKTPDKYAKYSRRSWDMLIKMWRKKLHQYDTEANEEPTMESDDSSSDSLDF